MRWDDAKAGFKDFWEEFKQEKSGIIGLALILIFVLTIICEPLIVPFARGSDEWRNIVFWEDNPRGVPPVWIDWFSPKKHARSTVLEQYRLTEEMRESLRVQRIEFDYQNNYHYPPADLILDCSYTGTPIINFFVRRPDGHELELLRQHLSNGQDKRARISVERSTRVSVFNFFYRFDRSVDVMNRQMIRPTELLFAAAKPGVFRHPEPLPGTYTFRAEIFLPNQTDTVQNFQLIIPGSASGVLGTDDSKRDIWTGIIAGVKWAMLIGLLTAIVAVSLGVVYGVICAYLGGWKDAILQRIFEIVRSIPLLPLLIVLSAVYKPGIYNLILMMSCFFWVGPVKTVRSMGMQIKEDVYIEASQSFGASGARIVFRHMVPLLIPYSFAAMALYVPRAIVYESTVSLLGLGDASIVTWGQILHDALKGGAVLNGQWWWVVPPGFLIGIMGMSFAFLGFAMDKILHPKLRTR